MLRLMQTNVHARVVNADDLPAEIGLLNFHNHTHTICESADQPSHQARWQTREKVKNVMV
jgi:peroxiredoxin